MTEEEKKHRAKFQRILKIYGITEEQYGLINLGYCPICLRPWSDTVKACVDHDHKTGDVRGLLCVYCNRYGVGRHRDVDVVRRIYEYLAAPRRGWIVPPKKKKKRKKKVKNV